MRDNVYLRRTRTGRVKDISKVFLGQSSSKLNPDHALAHAEDLSVVGQHRTFDGEGVVGGDGANGGDLVSSNCNTWKNILASYSD